ncbi:hypothetical protein Mycsm_07179 (plasmid) [Mycobacterium sp. JS623]|nr:hypothetical protein Mycsm_07179 [Mycobacterium sp. JS623]
MRRLPPFLAHRMHLPTSRQLPHMPPRPRPPRDGGRLLLDRLFPLTAPLTPELAPTAHTAPQSVWALNWPFAAQLLCVRFCTPALYCLHRRISVGAEQRRTRQCLHRRG